MKKEKQPEWLSKHLEENNVEVPIFPEKYGFDLGDKYAHVAKVIVEFEGKKYWTYATYLSEKSHIDHVPVGEGWIDFLVQQSKGGELTRDMIQNWYSEVL